MNFWVEILAAKLILKCIVSKSANTSKCLGLAAVLGYERLIF